MTSHPLIDAYLASLAQRLPADTIDELADGLTETFDRHRAAGSCPDQAAHEAIAEFGAADLVAEAFVRQAPGRRLARWLLASGPAVAACWATALVTSHAATWIPTPVRLAAAIALGTTVVVLLAAATGRNYRQTRYGAPAAIAVLAIDAAAIVATVAVAPARTWPMTLALTVSAARMLLVVRLAPRAFAR